MDPSVRSVGHIALSGGLDASANGTPSLHQQQQHDVSVVKQKMAELERLRRQAQEELDAARKSGERLSLGTVGEYVARENEYFDKFLEQVGKLPDPPKSEKFSLAIIGRTC